MEYRKETETYWNESAPHYSNTIQHEFVDEEKLWLNLIMKNAPFQDHPMRVLDIGCGPGFFTIILTKAGHHVTGIDCTPNMLEEARKNAKSQGVEAEFMQMDVHRLNFPDNTFDLVVSRNVTWTLYEPELAYKEWKRVLKPGGRMLAFDACWYMQVFKPEVLQEMKKGIKIYRKKHGDLPDRFLMHQREEYWIDLPMVGRERPLWDRAQLWKLAFKDIVSEDISALVNLEDRDIYLYGCVPMFSVRGTKQSSEEEKYWERKVFWDGYAPREGIKAMKMLEQGDLHYEQCIRPELPHTPAEVLDIGCGGGGDSLLMARDGYHVTGIDYSYEMVEEAQYSSEQSGIHVEFLKAEADKLPFEDSCFDVVLVDRMSEELFDRKMAEKEWHRVLRENGKIIVLN